MLPLVILIVLGGLWGVMLGMGKIAIPLGVPPIAFAFWTCVGGAVSITALTYAFCVVLVAVAIRLAVG